MTDNDCHGDGLPCPFPDCFNGYVTCPRGPEANARGMTVDCPVCDGFGRVDQPRFHVGWKWDTCALQWVRVMAPAPGDA